MRGGVTIKSEGLSHCAKGSKTREGVITLKKETDKHIKEHLNSQQRGHREGGGYCAALRDRKQGRRVIALKKQTDNHINEHQKAQKRGTEKRWGFEQKGESNDQKRASTRKVSERKTSETKTNERENERPKSERPQNEGNKNQRA